MSRRWLVRDGSLFADALVLSHPDQLTALTATVPEAAEVAVVAGDPSLDRMLASRGRRGAYRRALRAGPDTTVVTLSSTWGPGSLFGSWPELPRALLAELDADRHRVLLVLHPHVWWTHGPAQLRMMFADAVRAGLTLVPPTAGWQQALLAADVVVGDNGAVTGYAAALGRPTLLGAFPADDVVPGTAIAALGSLAPRLDRRRPLADQLRKAITEHRDDRYARVAALATATPGEAAERLRALCYRLLRRAEPATPVPVHPLPAEDLPAPARPAAFLVSRTVSGNAVRLTRRAADVAFGPLRRTDEDAFLAVADDHPLHVLRGSAAVRFRAGDESDPDLGAWLADVPGLPAACRIAAVLVSARDCVVHDGRTRRRMRATGPGLPVDALPAALHAWLLDNPDREPPARLSVTVADRTVPVDITPAPG